MYLVPIEVECYAGHKADERPVAFEWLGRRIEIREVVDRWYEGGVDPTRPVEDLFKVFADDGETYLLKHSRTQEAWYLCVRLE